MDTISSTLEAAAELVGGRAWGAEKGRPRIYMRSARDRKVYFEFPDAAYSTGEDLVNGATTLGGPAFKVWIDDCGQHPNWYVSEKQQIMKAARTEALALMAFTDGDPELAEAIMDGEEIDDLEAYDAAAGHITNGRFAEAREVLNEWIGD